MKLSKFKYKLPTERIAIHPASNRDESRLMVYHRKSGKVEHKMFKDIISYFEEGDTFVFNDTKVFPARLYGYKEKTGSAIEVFLLRELNRETRLWDVLVDPARKIRIGNKLFFGKDHTLIAEVIDNTTSRGRTLRFLFDGEHDEFKKVLYSMGETPLPRSIPREVVPEDSERYQTVYAENEGAVVAPTAGMHFSRELLKRMEIKGTNFAHITLHAGLGNFRAIEVEDLTKHKVDSEQILITSQAADLINKTKLQKSKICAVGTTVMRTIETAVRTDGTISPFDGWTSKFIFPPYDFVVADSMVTNFHFPYSSLMMMVAAFTGLDELKGLYNTAIKEEYNFGTYGDAMLIL